VEKGRENVRFRGRAVDRSDIHDEKNDLIEAILAIELEMFRSVPTETRSSCKDYPESFKLHRRVQFGVWSEDTLASYLDDLRRANGLGRNLMTYKYARMQNIVPPENDRPLIGEIVKMHFRWQKEMFEKYPAFMHGARPLSSDEDTDSATSFQTYLRGELESYSERTLRLLYRDMNEKLARGVNMSEEVYELLVKKMGYPSLAEVERSLADRGGVQ
jgi:hypothetical protein